jgi:uncharacterized YigZ family protein
MVNDKYITIKSPSEGIYKEKGSRFLACAFPISNEAEIRQLLEKTRKEHHEARHNCYAFMIGSDRTTWRINDDGEPSGTAGRPILGQINHFGLTNILIIVSRHFGGTLLGVSGLINAYKNAALSAIKNAEIIEKTLNDYYEIKFPFLSTNDVMKVLKEEGIGQTERFYDIECRIRINFRASAREKIINRLSRIEGLNCRFIETI